MKKIIGIDYGEKRVGLALAVTPIAEPLKVVDISKAISTILKMIDDFDVSLLIVGLSEGKMAKKTKDFVKKLKKKTDVLVLFNDETLSTKEARVKIRHFKKSKRGSPIDHYAACEILQDYIDNNL